MRTRDVLAERKGIIRIKNITAGNYGNLVTSSKKAEFFSNFENVSKIFTRHSSRKISSLLAFSESSYDSTVTSMMRMKIISLDLNHHGTVGRVGTVPYTE